MNLELGNDSQFWINTEVASIYSKTGEKPPDNPTAQIQGTLWLMIKKDMLPDGSPLLEMDLTVELPGRNLQAIVPKVNDLLRREKDGTFWRIGLVEQPAGVDYRVHVVRSTKR